MSFFKIGVITDSFRLSTKESIAKVKAVGAEGFQIYCTHGDMTPEMMTDSACRDFNRYVASLGLELSALCGDLGGGFLNADQNNEKVARSKEFIDLAVKLNTKIVTTHIGLLPQDESATAWQSCLEAVSELSLYAEQQGCYFATETGPENPVHLKLFLDKVKGSGIKVNYDPANLIMLGPFDHIGGLKVLKDYIVHSHAKDGVCLFKAENGENEYLEVPLGQGGVAFKYYLSALKDIGYRGFLTIEREVGENPEDDIRMAVAFLKGMIKNL